MFTPEDNTDGILSVLAETNPRLKVTTLSQETQFSEKQIINIGLKGSSSALDRFAYLFFRRNQSGLAGQPEWFTYT